MESSHVLLPFFLMVLSPTFITQAHGDVTKDTELVFAFMTHRHGDRTPVLPDIPLLIKLNTTAIKALIKPWGYGQLTDAGKKTAYKTGEFIRRRYNGFLSPKFDDTEMYIRSSDMTRTKMTVLTAMTAVYPPVGKTWSDQVNWVPTPYTTVPAKYDFNMAIMNCPKFMIAYISKLNVPSHPRMAPYADAIQQVSEVIGPDLLLFPVKVAQVYELFTSLTSLGYDLGDKLRELMPDLKPASDTAWDITTGDEKTIALNAGVLLNEFFVYARKIMEGKQTHKVRVYSAHDLNLYGFESVCHVERQGAPKYASLLSLELRRNIKTGKYYVLPVFLSDPHEGKEKYLEVKECGVLCDFDTFYNLTSKYIMDEHTWRNECYFQTN